MSCHEIRENLEPYLDGELPGEVKARVESHLPGCEACRGALEEIQLAWEALDDYPVPEVPVPDASRILQVARARERRGRLSRLASGVAAAVIVGVVIWRVLAPGGSVDLSPVDEDEIVTHWDLLENLDLLESMDVLENLDLIEEIPSDLLNGSEQG